MSVKKFLKEYWWLLLLLLSIFSMGYYLRAYNSLHHALPYSPYEAFVSNGNPGLLPGGEAKDFFDKSMRYPTSIRLTCCGRPSASRNT